MIRVNVEREDWFAWYPVRAFKGHYIWWKRIQRLKLGGCVIGYVELMT